MPMMKTIAAGLIAATTLTAVPANAASFSFGFGPGYGPGWGNGPGWSQDHRGPRWRHHRYERMSAHDVRRMLRNRGFHHIRVLDRRGPIFQVRAHRRGHAFFLVISARNGEILARHRV